MSRWAASAELFAPKKKIIIIMGEKKGVFFSFLLTQRRRGRRREISRAFGRRGEGVCDDTLRWEDTATAGREAGMEGGGVSGHAAPKKRREGNHIRTPVGASRVYCLDQNPVIIPSASS